MSVTDVFPLIKVPEAWPVPVVATVAMVALAGLDLAGAVMAKEWADHGGVRALVLGLASFLVLFWVYASSLRYAELALVTMGWVVMLQVGLVLVDRWRYGVELPTGKWIAIVVVLLAQAYLVLGPSAPHASGTPEASASASADASTSASTSASRGTGSGAAPAAASVASVAPVASVASVAASSAAAGVGEGR